MKNKTKKITVVMRATEEFKKTIEVEEGALMGDIKEQAYEDFQENHYNNFNDSWEYNYVGGSPEIEFVECEDTE